MLGILKRYRGYQKSYEPFVSSRISGSGGDGSKHGLCGGGRGDVGRSTLLNGGGRGSGNEAEENGGNRELHDGLELRPDC
jgi:hypothetical protein